LGDNGPFEHRLEGATIIILAFVPITTTYWFLCLTYDFKNLPLLLNYVGLELVVMQVVAKYEHETFIILQEKMKLMYYNNKIHEIVN